VGAGLLYALGGSYGPAFWALTVGSALGTLAVLFADQRPALAVGVDATTRSGLV
jgi:hypothetical protein